MGVCSPRASASTSSCALTSQATPPLAAAEATMHRVPRESNRPSELLATALREAPPELDDFARARLERNLVDAWRARDARAVELPRARSKPRLPAWALQVSA